MEPFRVITADPPWSFGDKLPGEGRGAEKHYDVLSIDEICAFPLPLASRLDRPRESGGPMNYEVHVGTVRVEGPFAVLDTALHAAERLTRPPPAPPKQYTHLARTLGTTDEDPYELGPAKPPRTERVVVIEREGRPGTPRARAFVENGRIFWAKECKSCKGQGGYTSPYGTLSCSECFGRGAVPDRSQP